MRAYIKNTLRSLPLPLLAGLSLAFAGGIERSATNTTQSASKCVAIVADFKARPGREVLLVQQLRNLVTYSRTNDKPLVYELLQSEQDPTRFVLYEVWLNQAALQSHLSTTMVEFTRNYGALMAGNIRTPNDIPATIGREVVASAGC